MDGALRPYGMSDRTQSAICISRDLTAVLLLHPHSLKTILNLNRWVSKRDSTEVQRLSLWRGFLTDPYDIRMRHGENFEPESNWGMEPGLFELLLL